TGLRSAENTRIPAGIVHDLPFRRKQSALGVQIHVAGLDLAEREAVYNVTRTYYAVQFARTQERGAKDEVATLQATLLLARAKNQGGGGKAPTPEDWEKLGVNIHRAESGRAQATVGVARAGAALREATGLGYDCPLDVPNEPIPEGRLQVSREEVIAL